MVKPLDRKVLSGGVISLNVGAAETSFDVHIELLCDCSPYFDELLKNRYSETALAPVNLPDYEPDIFVEFLNWLYLGQIFQGEVQPTLLKFLQLWVMAEKFQMPTLQNHVIARCKLRIEGKKNAALGIEPITYVYNNTTLSSPLRPLVAELWALRMTKGQFQVSMPQLPRAFLEDLCLFWIGNRNTAFEFTFSPTFEELHSVPPDDPRNLEAPEPATSEQMARRQIKSPRINKHTGSGSLSPRTNTPKTDTSRDSDEERDVSKKLKHLQV
ncbi:hypothetical protein F5884DRAFT_56879 [Xylogone sp. PMI_703]|nr:hypothetical protein F5884DRAFT_56879 [Xylogone sp. PMI_703]